MDPKELGETASNKARTTLVLGAKRNPSYAGFFSTLRAVISFSDWEAWGHFSDGAVNSIGANGAVERR